MSDNKSATQKPNAIIGNIQTLRFFAAVWVFLFHLKGTSLYHFTDSRINSFVSMGFAGVDIFFVISGYVMAITLRDKTPGTRSSLLFFSNRFGRIYSGWWPYFFVYLGSYMLLGKITPEADILGSFFLTPLLLQQYLVPVTWTLSFEMYFYLSLSAILILTKKYIPHILTIIAGMIGILTYQFYLDGIYTPDGVIRATRFQTFYGYIIILEFIAGYLMGCTLRFQKNYMIIPAAILLSIFLYVAYKYQNSGNLYPSGLAGFYHAPERVIYIGGASTFLVFIASQSSRAGFNPFPMLQKLGKSSYGLYLGHTLIIMITGIIVDSWMSSPIPLKTSLFTIIVIATTIIITHGISIYIEHPLNKSMKKLISKILN